MSAEFSQLNPRIMIGIGLGKRVENGRSEKTVAPSCIFKGGLIPRGSNEDDRAGAAP